VIEVDYRESTEGKGQKGLWEDLIKTSLPLKTGKLDGGDLWFLGRGPNDTEVSVGLEFKKLRDALTSIRTKRLQGHQLHELQAYDFRFMLIEGEWKPDDAGLISTRSGWKNWSPVPGNFSAAEYDKTVLGLVLRGGVHYVKETKTRQETVRWISALYRNFTDVAWDDHTSHLGVYRPTELAKPSEFRHFIMGLPNGCGMGLKTSKNVEAFFRNPNTGKASPRQAVAARADTWQLIDGVGKKTAQQIDAFLEGE
jgi:ERCC4-type nuclease